MDWERSGYRASDDRARLQVDVIHKFLATESYWAQGRSLEVVERAIRHSAVCIGIFDREAVQVAFARVVSDLATFGWLCDVFVVAPHRGRGLGKWLVELVLTHPDLRNVPRILLGTRDAHGLYAQYGFEPLSEPGRWMARVRPRPATCS